MENSIGDYFQRRQAWRSGLALRLRLLTQWCQSHALLSAANASRVAQIQSRLQSDSMVIGFFGEMGRGKSELINAIFFGTHSRRVLPVGPGHMTRCPVEISHAPGRAACLHLLPTETAMDPRTISEWEETPMAWTTCDMETDNAEQMAHALSAITQTSISSEATGDATVQTPRWRYARINMPLPALDQGLRVLDTPGLNAPGTVAEKTVCLLPLCDVIVLVLSADTGLTASELALWQNHLAAYAASGREILVVLNKADALWDGFAREIPLEQQLHRQQLDIAAILRLAPSQVFTVSAIQGFKAKVSEDAALLARSGLPELERAFAKMLYADRKVLWQRALEHAFSSMKADIEQQLSVRTQEIADQKKRVSDGSQTSPDPAAPGPIVSASDRKNGDRDSVKIKAIQSILHKQMKKIRSVLQQPGLKISIRQLELALASSPDIGSVQQAYAGVQEAVIEQWEPAAALAQEMALMLASALPAVIPDPVHAAPVPTPPHLGMYETQLNQAVAGHLQYLVNSRLHQLKQAEFTQELTRQLHDRLAEICHQMATDLDAWYRHIDAYLDRTIENRSRAAEQQHDRAQRATAQSERLLSELQAQEAELQRLGAMLEQHFSNLQDANADY